jgi:hypothetical protein
LCTGEKPKNVTRAKLFICMKDFETKKTQFPSRGSFSPFFTERKSWICARAFIARGRGLVLVAQWSL